MHKVLSFSLQSPHKILACTLCTVQLVSDHITPSLWLIPPCRTFRRSAYFPYPLPGLRTQLVTAGHGFCHCPQGMYFSPEMHPVPTICPFRNGRCVIDFIFVRLVNCSSTITIGSQLMDFMCIVKFLDKCLYQLQLYFKVHTYVRKPFTTRLLAVFNSLQTDGLQTVHKPQINIFVPARHT